MIRDITCDQALRIKRQLLGEYGAIDEEWNVALFTTNYDDVIVVRTWHVSIGTEWSIANGNDAVRFLIRLASEQHEEIDYMRKDEWRRMEMTKTNYIRSMAIEIARAQHALDTGAITPMQFNVTITDINARFEPTDNAWNNACRLADLMIQRGEVSCND